MSCPVQPERRVRQLPADGGVCAGASRRRHCRVPGHEQDPAGHGRHFAHQVRDRGQHEYVKLSDVSTTVLKCVIDVPVWVLRVDVWVAVEVALAVSLAYLVFVLSLVVRCRFEEAEDACRPWVGVETATVGCLFRCPRGRRRGRACVVGVALTLRHRSWVLFCLYSWCQPCTAVPRTWTGGRSHRYSSSWVVVFVIVVVAVAVVAFAVAIAVAIIILLLPLMLGWWWKPGLGCMGRLL